MNRRIGIRRNGVLVKGFLYNEGPKPIAELDSGSNVVARFVYGMRDAVPEYLVKGGQTYRIISDHLGSVRLVLDVATGIPVQRIDYDEYGQVTQNTNPGFQPFGYAGGLVDDSTRLVQFGARNYDPYSGRWITKDPHPLCGDVDEPVLLRRRRSDQWFGRRRIVPCRLQYQSSAGAARR